MGLGAKVGKKLSEYVHLIAALATIVGAGLTFFGITYASLSKGHPDATTSQKLAATTQSLLGQPEKALSTLGGRSAVLATNAAPLQPAPPATTQLPVETPVAIQSATTNGVTVSVTNLTIRDNRLYANLQIVNNTASRFHFLDAEGDAAQQFAIASGGNLSAVTASGMPACSNNAASCLDNYAAMAPSQFTYLDPGANMTASLAWYLSGDSKQTARAGSFGVTLIGHLLAPGSKLAETDKPEVFRFNFTGIPVAR